MGLGLGTSLSKGGLATPSIVTDSLVLKHNYAAGGVVPVSDGAAFFDGANDYISLGNDSSLQVGTSDFSLSAWAYRTADDGAIFSYGDIASVGWQIYQSGESEKIRVRVNDGSDQSSYSVAVFPEDSWVHVCVTMDRDSATGLKIYFDGVDAGVTEDDFTDEQSTLNHGSVGAYIGARYASGLAAYHAGYICNVGLWVGTILTEAQIKSIMWKNYAGLNSSETTGLVSWWNLDEADGSTVEDLHGSNDGTLS